MALTAEVVTGRKEMEKDARRETRTKQGNEEKKSKAILGGKEYDCGLVGVEAKTVNSWGEERTGPVDQRRKRAMEKDKRGMEGVWGGLTERK